VFTVAGGHNGNAEVDVAALIANTETSILGYAALGNVEIAEDLDARDDRGVPLLGNGLHGVLQDAVNAVLDRHFRVARFDVNIARAPLEGGKDDGFYKANNRADGGIARQTVARNGLFGLFLFLRDLQRESFGGLFENALRLLGALEEI